MGSNNQRKERPEPKALVVQKKGPKPACPYTRELADEICERLADGELLIEICDNPTPEWDGPWPTARVVRGWDMDNLDGFATRYARARQMGVETEVERLRQVTRDVRLGAFVTEKEVLTKTGEVITIKERRVGDMVQARALEADGLKWRISKMAWRDYGTAPGLEGKTQDKIDPEGEAPKIVIEGGLPDESLG